MKSILGIILILAFQANIIGQIKGDYVWQFGYNSQSPNPIYGGNYMDFNEYPVNGKTNDWYLNFDTSNASICDDNGNLLFYTNGISIVNKGNEEMENGDGLNPDGTLGFLDGMRLPQGVIVLQSPNNNDQYYLFHEGYKILSTPSGIDVSCRPLYYSLVDLSYNGGLGKVVEKNIAIVDDTLDTGKIVATRHANGRDWWLAVSEFETNRIYRLLLTPEGVVNHGAQAVGADTYAGLGQAVFSPDGSKYARMSLYDFGDNYLDIYDFDRCTGLFGNHTQYHFTTIDASGGVSISPDSRFLYLIGQTIIYQFDLQAADVIASKVVVAVYDGHKEQIVSNTDTFQLETYFFLGQLAPNGKIYINVPNSVRALHVIESPDKKGTACAVEQHGFLLPTLNNFTLPNFPNYRLGPLDGSPCDTLGLDNHPIAGFYYDIDSLVPLQVGFTDNSFYAPTDWLWDFGDNTTSTEIDPLHDYLSSGTYNVCLTVSNQYDSDTFCREVTVGTVGTDGADRPISSFVVFPNPASSALTLVCDVMLAAPAVWSLYNPVGQEVMRTPLPIGQTAYQIHLPQVPTGLYVWRIQTTAGKTQVGKLVIGD